MLPVEQHRSPCFAFLFFERRYLVDKLEDFARGSA